MAMEYAPTAYGHAHWFNSAERGMLLTVLTSVWQFVRRWWHAASGSGLPHGMLLVLSCRLPCVRLLSPDVSRKTLPDTYLARVRLFRDHRQTITKQCGVQPIACMFACRTTHNKLSTPVKVAPDAPRCAKKLRTR
eukprot:2637611-Pleurochrysis_carterae.AAC.6